MDRRLHARAPVQTHQVGAASLAVRPLHARPLSDIRETTEPSLLEISGNKESRTHQHSSHPSVETSSNNDTGPLSPVVRPSPLRPSARRPPRSPLRREITQEENSTTFVAPASAIPPRSSSRHANKRSVSIPRAAAVNLPTPRVPFRCIRNAGHTQSPVREVASRLDPYFDHVRAPSKTIVKVENFNANDILANPTHYHHRIKMDLLVVAPLFVGGSTVEGTVRIMVDEAERTRHRKTLTIERLQIDLIGVEEVSGGRNHVFIDLGNEIVDAQHPPPREMIESQHQLAQQENPWVLVPCAQELPFMLRLPLEVGPPPFETRCARIRYVLCATMHIKDGGRPLSVRTSQPTSILSVYDPEKALVSLPSPLTVTETCFLRAGHEITATAGLHRQVWISGTNLLADVHIVNNSRKPVKKIELQLERRVLCYKHAAATTLEMSASQARIFDQDERLIVSRAIIKTGTQGWTPIAPQSSVLRTCVLELPRDHATIKCNKYFEVRYFLNVLVPTSHTQPAVQLQLPIILIHMNSLDVPTNSVAQVAAAIEERRLARGGRPRSPSRHGRRPDKALQGRAFNAPRMQSMDRARQLQQDIEQLTSELETTPRPPTRTRHRRRTSGSGSQIFKTPPSNRNGRIIEDKTANEIRRQFSSTHTQSHDRGTGHARGASHSSNNTTQKSGPGPASASTVRGRANTIATPTPGRGHTPGHADTSALRFYLKHNDDKPYAKSYAGSLKPASLSSSFETKRRRWLDERWRPHWRGRGHRVSRSVV